MLLDGSLLFADKTAMGTTADTATNSSAKQISHFDRDLGVGSDVPILIMIDTVATSETATALTASIEVSANGTTAWQAIATSGAVPISNIEAGYVFGINKVPFYADKKFMRVSITPTGTAKAGTTFTAAIAEAVSLM